MSEIQFANLVAKFSTVLSVGISDVATSMVLESITTRDGEPLDDGLYAFVIDRGLENEEFVIGTLAETGVFTFLVRGVSYIDGATSIPANIFSHRKGATIEITAHPVLTELVNRFTDFFNTYNGKWSGAVADYASLPEGQNDGEARVTLDDSKIYIWSAAEESWKLSGAGGAGGTVYVTHKLGSESVGGDMKTFVLDSGSFPLDKFLQVYLNGTLQELATDYTTSNNNTIIFKNEVEATDKITMLVVSVSLVALGGVLTQDVIPDADEAYNIGSDEYKVNEIHVKELNAANMIDPDNPVAQSPAQLIGGDDVVLQNFINLGVGDNDGAFKMNIDGVEYDDVAIDVYNALSNPSNSASEQTEQLAIGSTASNEMFGYPFVFWQTFTMPANVFIKKIKLYQHGSDGSNIKICKANANDTLESTDALAIGSYSGAEGEKEITLSSPVYTGKTQRKFAVVVYGTDGGWRYLKTSGSRSYMDGRLWNYDQFKNKDLYLKVYVSDVDNNLFLVDLEGKMQTAIRTATSNLETVVYDTDHFEITSTIGGKNNGSSVLRLTAPTTGTDISGAGYLDLGANATEVAGDGDDYKLVRLDEYGKLPDGLNNIGENQIVSGRALNTVYQNTSARTIIVLVSTYNKGYNEGNRSTSSALIGTTSTPNISVGYASSGDISANHFQLFMIVPPGYYYTITATKGGSATLPSLVSWFECDLI